MFKYFPANYPWNLSVMSSIEMGARMGEIAEMFAPLIEASEAPDGEGTAAFRKTWVDMVDRLCALAEEDRASGRDISAGDKFLRASNYLLTAERLQAHGAAGRLELYERFLDVFAHGLELTHADLINSPRRELKIFDGRTGGVQHSSFDNSANAGAYIADWVAEVLGGRTA